MNQFDFGDLVILTPGSERYSITNDCTICRVVEPYVEDHGVGDLVVEVVKSLTEDEMDERNTCSRSFFEEEIGGHFTVESMWFELYQPAFESAIEVTPMDDISFEEVFADE